jgi:DNA polymerase-3 subunit gamma/tau
LSDAGLSDVEPPAVETPAVETPAVEPPAAGTPDAGAPDDEVPDAGAPDPEPSPDEPTTELVRRRWPEVLANIPAPGARAFLAEYAQVMTLARGVLTLGFPSSVVTQARRGQPETITKAVYETLGVAVSLDIQPSDAASATRPREAEARRRAHAPVESDDPAPPPSVAPSPTTVPAPSVRAESRSPGSSPATPQAVAFYEADAAWLAGTATYEPPPEDEPEPPEDVDPARTQPSAPQQSAPQQSVPPADRSLTDGASVDRAPGTAHENAARATATVPAPPPAPPQQPGPPRRETAVEAVQRHALRARGRGNAPQPSSATGPDPYDDAATDDPDIASTGLVGVPLALKLLNGAIIDEQVDHT